MSATTDIQELVKGIGGLVGWFKANRTAPYTQRLHVKRAHWDLLHKRQDLATRHGFVIDGDRISYQGFELSPTDCGARHTRERGPCK
jgi:hypothetical protein